MVTTVVVCTLGGLGLTSDQGLFSSMHLNVPKNYQRHVHTYIGGSGIEK